MPESILGRVWDLLARGRGADGREVCLAGGCLRLDVLKNMSCFERSCFSDCAATTLKWEVLARPDVGDKNASLGVNSVSLSDYGMTRLLTWVCNTFLPAASFSSQVRLVL